MTGQPRGFGRTGLVDEAVRVYSDRVELAAGIGEGATVTLFLPRAEGSSGSASLAVPT